MKRIENLTAQEYQIEDVRLRAGETVEMEDTMAERFLAEFAGQVEVAKATLKVSEKKVTKKKK